MEPSANIAIDHSLLAQAELVAKETNLPVEQIIQSALQQGLTELRSESFFRSRRGRGNVEKALAILRRAGNGRPPDPGDEIPDDVRALYPEIQSR